MSDKPSNAFQVDSYLFWLRLKQILFVSSIVIIFAGFLSITIFYRFDQLDQKWDKSVNNDKKILLR